MYSEIKSGLTEISRQSGLQWFQETIPCNRKILFCYEENLLRLCSRLFALETMPFLGNKR